MNRRAFLSLVPATIGAAALVKPNVKPELRTGGIVRKVTPILESPKTEYSEMDFCEVTCFGDAVRTYVPGDIGKR